MDLMPCGTYAAYQRHKRRNEIPCDPCAVAAREMWRMRATNTPFDDSKCGTTAGYSRHVKRGLPPCDACRAAKRVYDNQRNRAKGMKERLVIDNPCGTVKGYHRHQYEGSPKCCACAEAYRAHKTQVRRDKGIPEFQPAECGTRSGYMRHYRNGEPACEPCLASYRGPRKPRRYWQHIWYLQCGTCPLCLRRMPFVSEEVHLDHILPKSLGGNDDLDNLQIVHSSCNLVKRNLTDEEARYKIVPLVHT